MKKFAALVAVLALICFAAPAFAANPFMDVPMNHWAYDAVSQLASRGVVSGYPDGAFKGEWKATRYEMASVVARALAYVDMNKASKQDLELLKKLVVEFKDELDALGVKVDELDSRVALLEEGVGGWKFWGQFRFDAKWAAEEEEAYTSTGDTDFTVSRYRIWLSKKIDDKVTFIGRIGGADATFERYYLEVKLPWDATMWVGKWLFEWEGGYWTDNDAWFTDIVLQGFYFTKPFNMGTFDFFVAHKEEPAAPTDPRDNSDAYVYGARVLFDFNEQFGMGLVGLMENYDDSWDVTTYWVQGHVNFTPDIALRGRYIWQDDDFWGDKTNAWQAVLQVNQAVTGFTSVWVEYAKLDAGFEVSTADPYADWGQDVLFASNTWPNANRMMDDTTALFVRLDQQWNDKWATFQRYINIDDDDENARVWTFGVKYWYTPALSFELSYDDTSYDYRADDSLIRFRTFVSF